MYVRPSTSRRRDPEARLMNNGSRPTALKARTGLLTPPGRICCARANSFADFGVFDEGRGMPRIIDVPEPAAERRSRKAEGRRQRVEGALFPLTSGCWLFQQPVTAGRGSCAPL